MPPFDKILPPSLEEDLGVIHPINQTKNFLMRLLIDIGFEQVKGPEIESQEYNFDMLNIKESHPARFEGIKNTYVSCSNKSNVRFQTSFCFYFSWKSF